MATLKTSRPALIPRRDPAPTISHHKFRWGEQWINYSLRRTLRRRSIAMVIDEEGLRVNAPCRTSQGRVESLLASHAHWIVRKLAEWEARRPPPFSWQAGAHVMVMGQPLALTPAPGRTSTGRDDECLYVATGTNLPEVLAQHVTAWLRGTAQDWFTQRALHYAPALAVRMPAIALSNARTRWGTCHPGGRIRLNWRLIQMPPCLIDYVVVHELAHLHEPNHSPRFWRRVAEVLPDHQVRRRTLRLEGHRYLIG